MTLTIINIMSSICALVVVWATLELFAITQSRGILFITAGSIYLATLRIAVTITEFIQGECWFTQHTSYFVAPFWPVMAVGFVLLLRSLRDLYTIEVPRYSGPERRKNG